MSLRDAYAGKRVFITGHTGFKGAWLAYWLSTMGAAVFGYSLNPFTSPNLFDALQLEGLLRHVAGDVRDQRCLIKEMCASRPEIVFHLAAQPIVRHAYVEPRETFETNVIGTVNVLEAVRRTGTVRAVVVVTSDKCYRNLETGRPFREEDSLGGRDPYSASKGCAELVTEAYRESYFSGSDPPTAVASVRAGNVIGGGDWSPHRIIPDCVRAVVAERSILVRNPEAVRPWQHVLEPLSGYVRLGSLLLNSGRTFAGPWNFGPTAPDSAHSVRWVVEQFLKEWGTGSWTTAACAEQQPHEAAHLSLDSSKARTRLGWAGVWDAETSIRQTARWYRDFYGSVSGCRPGAESSGEPSSQQHCRARELLDAQLQEYMAQAAEAGLGWAS